MYTFPYAPEKENREEELHRGKSST